MNEVRILRVVVASPGDVQKERDLLPGVVEELNRGMAARCGFRIDLYRWETHAYPGLHAEGPQGLIDTILRIEDCDALIGIFWTRFGTPTKDGKTGTEHEFHLAYEAWRQNKRPQVMVYFNQKPYTPQLSKEAGQWQRVLEFREKFPEEGLWWAYKNERAFERLVRNHLMSFIQQLVPATKATSVVGPAAPLNMLHSLPPPPTDFTGREPEMDELRTAIEKGGVTISGLQGQGGVGKTALALKLADELAPRFPDAQLYVDLRGVSEKPLTSGEAMAFVVRAFHPEAKLPEGEAELSAAYQTVLHGQRALLLLDNARDAAQVKPLLPSKSCVLLVTSRQQFALHGLRPKHLDALPPADAEALLREIEPRIGNEAARIAQLCGYLPQALRLAAGSLLERPSLEPADYARRLSDEKKRLDLLKVGDSKASDQSMAASIELSCSLLDAEMQRRWRALAVFPDTFHAPAAAAVWAIEDDVAQDALDRLLQYSMLEWNATARRYRLHDLMHDFARGHWEELEREQAARCHAVYYAGLLDTADAFYLKGGDSIAQGLALFDLEWGNIRAGQSWAAKHRSQDAETARLCSDYPNAGVYCLDLRLHPSDRMGWLEAALAAARHLKDRETEAVHLGNLGIRYWEMGEPRRAIEYYEQHLALSREIDYRRGEGKALGNLGLAYADLGETRRAIEYYEHALSALREIGDRRDEGALLGNLGAAYHRQGEPSRAIEYYQQALSALREMCNRQGEGAVLCNLGSAYGDLGETQRAIEYYEQALAITREIGDRRGEANSLFNMGLALDKLGNSRGAIQHAQGALAIYEQIEDPNAAQVRKQLEAWKG